jgi:hypothetical protein
MAKAPEVIISLEKGEIAKLHLKDGDMIVVKIPSRWMKYVEGIGQRIKPGFPGHKVLILPNDFDLSVVERGEEDGVA